MGPEYDLQQGRNCRYYSAPHFPSFARYWQNLLTWILASESDPRFLEPGAQTREGELALDAIVHNLSEPYGYTNYLNRACLIYNF